MAVKIKILNITCGFFILLLLLWATYSKAVTINQTLYINKGTFVAVIDSNKAPYYAFNSTKLFNARNAVLNLTRQDVLVLKIINTDSTIHGFNIKNHAPLNSLISPGDSVTHTLNFNSQGVFIYYDCYQYPKYNYMGAAGMICVADANTGKKFYWNFKDHQLSYNEQLNSNKVVNWKTYSPDWHTINGLSFPYTVSSDSTALITGKLGDTLHLYIANTGQADRCIHIHGFHAKIIQSSVAKQSGRVKDSFPVPRMESMVIELVPHQLGKYSVHDNNLTANTGGGTPPLGMIAFILIEK